MKLKSFYFSAALLLATFTFAVVATSTVATAKTYTVLYSFTGGADGDVPFAGVVQATDGNLYGTTFSGGANNNTMVCPDGGCGTIFKITPSGTLTTLYSFCSQSHCEDGASPDAGLIQATDGNLYGTTQGGGAYTPECVDGCGIVFKITPGGTLTTLHRFNKTDGAFIYAPLVQATDGNFYGTAFDGGANGLGTVFTITPKGTLTTLYSFSGLTDGQQPFAGLVQAADGNLYGTTSHAGAYGFGTIFKITPGGALTTLQSFDGTDGAYPYAGLIQATDGNLYGTTFDGGAYGFGTIFKITPGGALTTLYSFCSQWPCTDGRYPYAGLLQATDGSFYGTTWWGGTTCCDGTVFSISVGLGPFVETQPAIGKVEGAVEILGTSLTGATSVNFNGSPAVFTVRSRSLITATVPAGATTGFVTVTTPRGILASNLKFRVTPQLLSFSPPGGPVGTSVVITGNSLTQTTKVGFGGVAATSFTVDSDTQVTATVPAGAVTGPIEIKTAGGIAASSTSFTVTQ